MSAAPGRNLILEGKWAILTWEIHERGVEAIDQVGDGAVAVCYNILSELCGSDWKPTEAWFAHRRPADITPFREFFRIPLRFDAEQFALVFPAALLKRPLPRSTRSCVVFCRARSMCSRSAIATTFRSRFAACCARRS